MCNLLKTNSLLLILERKWKIMSVDTKTELCLKWNITPVNPLKKGNKVKVPEESPAHKQKRVSAHRQELHPQGNFTALFVS